MEKEQLLKNLGVGSKFSFRNIEWVVTEAYRYDWEDEGDFSIEFKIISGVQESYLELAEEDEELELYFSSEIDNDQLKPIISIDMLEGEEVITEVAHLGSTYNLDEIEEGMFTDLSGKEESMAFTNFDYLYNDFFVNIVLWKDKSLDFSYGEEISLDQISNIKN